LDSAGDSPNYEARTNTGSCFRQLTHLPAFKCSLWGEQKYIERVVEENLISKRRKILRKWIITVDALLRIVFISGCLTKVTVRLWFTALNVKWVSQINWKSRAKCGHGLMLNWEYCLWICLEEQKQTE
jgi:hypothetical protein